MSTISGDRSHSRNILITTLEGERICFNWNLRMKRPVWAILFDRYFRTPTKMLLNCDVGEDSWESLGLQGDSTDPSQRKSVLNIHWKDWCWSWNSNTLATWCKEPTQWKRPWCWERLKVGGVGDDRGWDGWMASLTQWTWVWTSSGSWWWTGRSGML